ncbi:uncharacterized protein LOC106174045 [Lingula anatina]|uniref:Uncharacterized protein LOC106174045 n=1 Tax=Lingula anatina TaxID=7574 RepID=A0A1S3JKC7_LINAN|nr:uncharacterized protein LOC106174045 [Lingula anatina]|eukprot:XP_013410875.1 uncharacterized protein LOC106174045 [Lingula anatina]
MTMIHLKYPHRRGFFTWEEMGCLARSLGFPDNVFRSNIPENEAVKDLEGLTIPEFHRMIDYKYFVKALHRTFNMHTADWNQCVVKRAVRLLDYHALSFEELQDVRIAYQVYEAGDMKGILVDEHIVLRALKMCGRVIAPLKMMQRLKHMSQNFDENGRMQLYEFLDLILWCDLYKDVQVERPSKVEATGKTKYGLYKLDDFEDLLHHQDEVIATHLNQNYLNEEWDFGKEIIKSLKQSREPPVKATDKRKQMVKFHKGKYQHLKSEVVNAQKRVYHAKAGYVRPRPISAPDLEMYDRIDPTMVAPSNDIRPQTVYETLEQMKKARAKKTETDSAERHPLKVDTYVRPHPSMTVTDKDIKDTENLIQSLQFEMETLENRYQHLVDTDLDYLMPGYRERLEEKQKPEPPPPPTKKPKVKKKKPPSEQFLRKMAYTDVGILPSHARACDARFRGWHKVRTQAGTHYILSSPSYEKSPRGLLHRKLHESAMREIRHIRGEAVYRHSKRSEVKPEITREKTMLGSQKFQSEDSDSEISPTDQHAQVSSGQTTSGESGYRTKSPSVVDTASESSVSFSDFNMYGEVLDDRKKTEEEAGEMGDIAERGLVSHTDVDRVDTGVHKLREKVDGTGSTDREKLLIVKLDRDKLIHKAEREKSQHKKEYEQFERQERSSPVKTDKERPVHQPPAKPRAELPVGEFVYGKPKIIEMSKMGKVSVLENILEVDDDFTTVETKSHATSRDTEMESSAHPVSYPRPVKSSSTDERKSKETHVAFSQTSPSHRGESVSQATWRDFHSQTTIRELQSGKASRDSGLPSSLSYDSYHRPSTVAQGSGRQQSGMTRELLSSFSTDRPSTVSQKTRQPSGPTSRERTSGMEVTKSVDSGRSTTMTNHKSVSKSHDRHSVASSHVSSKVTSRLLRRAEGMVSAELRTRLLKSASDRSSQE